MARRLDGNRNDPAPKTIMKFAFAALAFLAFLAAAYLYLAKEMDDSFLQNHAI